eukprot:5066817-Amphidinium_carterae.2
MKLANHPDPSLPTGHGQLSNPGCRMCGSAKSKDELLASDFDELTGSLKAPGWPFNVDHVDLHTPRAAGTRVLGGLFCSSKAQSSSRWVSHESSNPYPKTKWHLHKSNSNQHAHPDMSDPCRHAVSPKKLPNAMTRLPGDWREVRGSQVCRLRVLAETKGLA